MKLIYLVEKYNMTIYDLCECVGLNYKAASRMRKVALQAIKENDLLGLEDRVFEIVAKRAEKDLWSCSGCEGICETNSDLSEEQCSCGGKWTKVDS